VGSAATMKLARNQLIASLLSAYALSLILIESENLSVDTFMQILRQDALFAPILDKKLDAMLGGEFATASFAVKNLLKDVDLFLAEVREHDLPAASLQSVRDMLQSAVDYGWADADYAAIYGVISKGNYNR
jgi:3-hydroxyisobutyrate dehydrogenase-like beta-hydroxyacid dehydrogenase